MTINLIAIHDDNLHLLQPFCEQPQLLQAAGMDYQPQLGLWGFQMLLQHEQLFLIQSDQQPAGLILISHCYDQTNQPIVGQGEVGYCVLPSMQGRGVATHGLAHVLTLPAVTTKYALLWAEVAATNQASQRVLIHNQFHKLQNNGQTERWQFEVIS